MKGKKKQEEIKESEETTTIVSKPQSQELEEIRSLKGTIGKYEKSN